jgi:CDP-glucose 4,6-dehydratase
MSPEFWNGKRVLVTGHTGFKGSWLSLCLRSMGAKVTGYSLDCPSEPCLYELAGVSADVTDVKGDVRDLGALQSCIEAGHCEIVIHMAAQSLVRRSYHNPLETYSTNVMGTANVLEAVRAAGGVRVVIIVTSDKCYENLEQDAGYRETDRMGGYDPYSSSKGCAELLTTAWRNSYFNPVDLPRHGVALASARAGNVIGGGDWAEDRIIPDIMNAYHEMRPVRLRNPDAVRPWQFVMEPLNGYLALAEHLWGGAERYSRAWNFGPDAGDFRPVAWLADALAVRWGAGAGWEHDGDEHPHEARLLHLDCTAAHRQLGWQPVLDIETTMDWIVEWYRAFFEGADVRAVTLDQVRRYQERALHE